VYCGAGEGCGIAEVGVTAKPNARCAKMRYHEQRKCVAAKTRTAKQRSALPQKCIWCKMRVKTLSEELEFGGSETPIYRGFGVPEAPLALHHNVNCKGSSKIGVIGYII